MSTCNFHKLRMVQKYDLAVWPEAIIRSPRSVATSQLLSNLHWLPIHKQIHFKVATLTYKVLSTQQFHHQPSHSLRSSGQSLLHVPRAKTDFGRRAFSSAAPQI